MRRGGGRGARERGGAAAPLAPGGGGSRAHPGGGGRRPPRILVGVTGASGIAYARRLLDVLGDRADVILTKDAEAVIEIEAGVSVKEFAAGSRTVHRGEDLAAAPASGSHPFRA